MDWLTALVALVGAAGVLASSPPLGLMIYLIITLLYPDHMRIGIAGVEVNAERIALCLLLLKCLTNQALLQRFRWNNLDKAVILSLCVYAGTMLLTTPLGDWLRNRSSEATRYSPRVPGSPADRHGPRNAGYHDQDDCIGAGPAGSSCGMRDPVGVEPLSVLGQLLSACPSRL